MLGNLSVGTVPTEVGCIFASLQWGYSMLLSLQIACNELKEREWDKGKCKVLLPEQNNPMRRLGPANRA